MTSTRSALDADWLGVCRRAVAGLDGDPRRGADARAERAEETGTRGSGGDRTLVIDRAAEAVVFEELDALHQTGHGFRVVSEERGEVDYGDPGCVVIIDPIDGSLNAKRGSRHYALSIAVADGPTMADVAFGFVYDFGPREEWWARRGEGAWLQRRAPRSRAARAPRLATAGSRCSGSSRPTRAGWRRRSTRWWRAPTGCGRWGRSPSTLCQVAGRPLRRDGLAAALPAASTPPPAS